MESTVVCSLRYIKADESIYGFRVGNYSIAKGSERLSPEFFTQNFVQQAGEMTVREFLNYPFFYVKIDNEPEYLGVYANNSHTMLNLFVNFLWLSKDNSVNVGDLFAFLPGTKHMMRSRKLATYSNAEGNHEEVVVTKADLEIAATTFEQFVKLASDSTKIKMPKKEITERPSVSDSLYHYGDYNQNTRIERAFSFLTMARVHSFLPLKISLCMSLLECLFTTDRQEVTHKVCERVALYVGGNYEERLHYYKTIKEAYDVRSGFFHGQDIGKKQDTRDNLTIHSQKVDTILRIVLKKVLLEDHALFNGPDKARIEFFNQMVLG